MRSVYALAFLVAFATPTLAFFEQFFHQGQAPPPPPAFNLEAQRDAISCAEYLCPMSLECRPSPADCSCPSSVDKKCVVGDEGAFVCARSCEGVNEAARGI
ncbi:hypothetical protein BCR35DRAFT_297841 [Leucosporidium creatinivorum]|uniref:Long chronological lifespan protein 2 n=1 Tax=Leucosporidium creatinivorum TaxID=106004 RepID=A0A1Y2G3C9_9BASI|nr:hypothetical protein BCR35DRAFT_297841 [Leucosporidium creatinivorum]